MVQERDLLAIELVYAYEYLNGLKQRDINAYYGMQFAPMIEQIWQYSVRRLQEVTAMYNRGEIERFSQYFLNLLKAKDAYSDIEWQEKCAFPDRAKLEDAKKRAAYYEKLMEEYDDTNDIHLNAYTLDTENPGGRTFIRTRMLKEATDYAIKSNGLSEEEGRKFRKFLEPIFTKVPMLDQYRFHREWADDATIKGDSARAKLLNSLVIIPPYYQTLDAIEHMMFYLVNRRADTVKEAINLYEDEKWKHAMMQGLSQINMSVNMLGDRINTQTVAMASACRCLSQNMRNGFNLVSEKIDQLTDAGDRHYLAIAKKLADMHSSDLAYQKDMRSKMQGLSSSVYGISTSINEITDYINNGAQFKRY